MADGSVPITAGSGTNIRALTNSGVQSGAYQQVMTIADDQGDFISSSLIPAGVEDALMVRAMPTQITRTGFSDTISGGVDPAWGVLRQTGAGMAVNQTGGNLVITSGTSANSETIIRSNASFSGAVRMRSRSTLSQRITGQQFFVELVDVIGDGLAITIASATSVTVTFATAVFTTNNVGQYMTLGGYSGSGTFIPGRYPIASVSGNQVTYTVSGFASGSGTVSVFGWNYHRLQYAGTNASAALWDTQRKGWASGDTTIAPNSSASPGHLIVMAHNDMQAQVLSAYTSTTTGVQYTPLATRVENVPDDTSLRVQIRVVVSSSGAASSTTWTMGHLAVGNWSAQDVTIQDVRPLTYQSALPVQVAGIASVSLSAGANSVGTIGLNAGTNLAGAVAIGATTQSASFYTSTTTNAATVAKSSAGNIQILSISNTSASAQWVKIFNATAVTLATTAAVMDIPVAAGVHLTLPFGVNGARFTAGIAYAVTGAVGATNNTAGAGGVLIALTYV